MIAELQHMPITLGNESECQRWYERLKKLTGTGAASMMQLRATEALRKWPDLHDYIDPSGGLKKMELYRRATQYLADNAEWREEILAENKRLSEAPRKRGQKIVLRDVPKVMTPEEAAQLAYDALNRDWQTWLKANMDCAKVLFFDVASFPVTLPALREGIACIKATVHREVLTPEQLANIDSPLDSTFWKSVTAHEVASYCDRFCGSVSGDVLVDLVGPAMADYEARTARQVRSRSKAPQLPN